MSWFAVKQWLEKWWLLLLPTAIATCAVFAYAYTFQSLPATQSPIAWGTFGDYLGGLLNPLVSVLTLFVAISVWRLQKDELELTRKELAQTKVVMEEQAKTAEQQRREQRFFDLLNLYHTTVQSVTTGVRDQQSGLLVVNGKQAIGRLVLDLGFRVAVSSPRGMATYLPPSQVPKAVEKVQELGDHLDHYFRVVFTFLREAEVILGEDHFRYVKLFRAQLSRGELHALSLNLVFDPEGKKLRPYIERYGILKHLQDSQVRRWAEDELRPQSFGRHFAHDHTIGQRPI
jgi:hypothetical protein